jgi:hypothetical protein
MIRIVPLFCSENSLETVRSGMKQSEKTPVEKKYRNPLTYFSHFFKPNKFTMSCDSSLVLGAGMKRHFSITQNIGGEQKFLSFASESRNSRKYIAATRRSDCHAALLLFSLKVRWTIVQKLVFIIPNVAHKTFGDQLIIYVMTNEKCNESVRHLTKHDRLDAGALNNFVNNEHFSSRPSRKEE